MLSFGLVGLFCFLFFGFIFWVNFLGKGGILGSLFERWGLKGVAEAKSLEWELLLFISVLRGNDFELCVSWYAFFCLLLGIQVDRFVELE